MKKIALAALGAYSLAAASGSLWGPNTDYFPSLQIRVPAVVSCWAEHPDPMEGNPCYDEGGWWWGYDDGDAQPQVWLDGDYTPFVYGVSLTEPSLGGSLIQSDALRVKFRAGAAASTDAPTIAGIGFEFYSGGSGTENIHSKDGYCLTYSSTIDTQFELTWDEATYNYDTWFVKLPAKSSKTTITIKWTGGTQSAKQAGDFMKDGWGTEIKSQPVTTATEKAIGAKIRLKNGTSTEQSGDFALYELGWAGDGCDGGVGTPSPIISKNAVANTFGLNLHNRMLSMTVKSPASVQILNLQGAVVHNQVYVPGSKMNLNNLPMGVYMVRVPSLGYSGKIILK
ncbi:MAG: T9SS type A sorting domain-containing protein [Candidatus Fibromonas sp.]|nr:T9SS type A sorting domain-containing protein [Candidatus Fibromonas sp.]